MDLPEACVSPLKQCNIHIRLENRMILRSRSLGYSTLGVQSWSGLFGSGLEGRAKPCRPCHAFQLTCDLSVACEAHRCKPLNSEEPYSVTEATATPVSSQADRVVQGQEFRFEVLRRTSGTYVVKFQVVLGGRWRGPFQETTLPWRPINKPQQIQSRPETAAGMALSEKSSTAGF